MKIRNRFLLRAAGWSLATAARALVRTVRFDYKPLGLPCVPCTLVPPGPGVIYTVWHEYLLLPAARLGHPDIAVLISKHADGQLLGSLVSAMGMGMVAGSTNRGGVTAVRQLLAGFDGRRHLTVTPDGPRGPRRVVQAGVVYVAAKTGLPVMPVGVGYAKPLRTKSWDRFAVPLPLRRVRMVTGDPIHVPEDVTPDTLEPYRLQVQAAMDRLTDVAETWAATGTFPDPPAVAPPLKRAS